MWQDELKNALAKRNKQGNASTAGPPKPQSQPESTETEQKTLPNPVPEKKPEQNIAAPQQNPLPVPKKAEPLPVKEDPIKKKDFGSTMNQLESLLNKQSADTKKDPPPPIIEKVVVNKGAPPPPSLLIGLPIGLPTPPPQKKPDPKPPTLNPAKVEAKPEASSPIKLQPKGENHPPPKIFDPLPQTKPETKPETKPLPEQKQEPLPQISVSKPTGEPSEALRKPEEEKPSEFKDVVRKLGFPSFNLMAAPKKNKKKLIVCVTHESGKSQTQEEIVKFSAKHASLAPCFKDNNSVKKTEKKRAAEPVVEEKKQDIAGGNPPPPPPPNLNVKPPPPLGNLLLGNSSANVPPQKVEESFDAGKLENARNELKRRLEEKKAEDKFEECIKIREKIKKLEDLYKSLEAAQGESRSLLIRELDNEIARL